jgi:hypothetical protein
MIASAIVGWMKPTFPHLPPLVGFTHPTTSVRCVAIESLCGGLCVTAQITILPFRPTDRASDERYR